MVTVQTPGAVVEILKRVLAVVLGVVLAAGMAEGLIRGLARLSPDIDYLATAGTGPTPRIYASLEEFLDENRAKVGAPHREYFNYYLNALGFNDREFSVEKPAGTSRLMGLGDSFLYGYVPHPQNVFTLVGRELRDACGTEAIETMNFGIPAIGLWEYRLIQKLAAPRYRPDRVVVHFYMGNDGPDLLRGTGSARNIASRQPRSYAWSFLVNAVTLLRAVERPVAAASAPAQTVGSGTAIPRGGDRASDRPDPTDDDMAPTYTEQAFADIELAELSQLYAAGNAGSAPPDWTVVFDLLETLRTEVVANTGHPPILVLYPSALQVYPERLAAAAHRAAQRYAVDPRAFDPALPSRMLEAYCGRAGLSCLDVTPAIVAAAHKDPKPLYRFRDTHWTARGNRVAAAAEAAFLKTEVCRQDARSGSG